MAYVDAYAERIVKAADLLAAFELRAAAMGGGKLEVSAALANRHMAATAAKKILKMLSVNIFVMGFAERRVELGGVKPVQRARGP